LLEDGPSEPLSEGAFTVDTAIDAAGFGRYQLVLAVLAGMLFATDAIQLTLLSFFSPAARCTFGITLAQEAWIASTVFAGNFIGSYCCGVLADRLGRRVVFLGAAAVIVVFSIFSAFSSSYEMLLVGQFLVGLGIGAVPISYSLYAEFVPTEGRGQNGVIIQVAWTIGALCEAVLAWAIMPTLGWRWLVALSATPPLLLLLAFPLLPESPKWQAVTGRKQEAYATLLEVTASNGREWTLGSEDQLVVSADEIVNDVGLKDLFQPGYAKLTTVIWALWLLCTLLYYGAILLATEIQNLEKHGGADAACDLLDSEDYIRAGITASAELPAFIAAVLLVDRVGRCQTINVSFLAMAVALIAIIFVVGNVWVETLLVFGARAAVMCGCLAIYIGTSELYPTHMRGTGMGTANAIARLGGFAAPWITSVLLNETRTGGLAALAVISVMTAWTGLQLPETSREALS